MNVFSMMGVPVSRTAHARLFVNEQYVGLYSIVESVDKRFLTRHFNENDGYLYKYQWATPYYFEDKGAIPRPTRRSRSSRNARKGPAAEAARGHGVRDQRHAGCRFRARGRHLRRSQTIRHAGGGREFPRRQRRPARIRGDEQFLSLPVPDRPGSTFIPWDKSEAFKSDRRTASGPTSSMCPRG